jgi:hypothetical protein
MHFGKSISIIFSILAGPVIPPKPQAIRGIDLDAQGMINGQPTYEHDLMNSYKDDEKPWKKPGLMKLHTLRNRLKLMYF